VEVAGFGVVSLCCALGLGFFCEYVLEFLFFLVFNYFSLWVCCIQLLYLSDPFYAYTMSTRKISLVKWKTLLLSSPLSFPQPIISNNLFDPPQLIAPSMVSSLSLVLSDCYSTFTLILPSSQKSQIRRWMVILVNPCR